MKRVKKIIALASSLLLLLAALSLLFQKINFSYFLVLSFLVLLLYLFLIYIIGILKKEKNVGEEVSKNPVLYSTKSVFPFQFFPDHYIVHENNFFIIRKTFFSTGWTEMLPLKDIASVRMYSGPYFASVTIMRKVIPQTSFELKDLWKKDAIKLKEILDGLIMKEAKIINIPEQMTSKDKAEMLIDKVSDDSVKKEM